MAVHDGVSLMLNASGQVGKADFTQRPIVMFVWGKVEEL